MKEPTKDITAILIIVSAFVLVLVGICYLVWRDMA